MCAGGICSWLAWGALNWGGRAGRSRQGAGWCPQLRQSYPVYGLRPLEATGTNDTNQIQMHCRPFLVLDSVPEMPEPQRKAIPWLQPHRWGLRREGKGCMVAWKMWPLDLCGSAADSLWQLLFLTCKVAPYGTSRGPRLHSC